MYQCWYTYCEGEDGSELHDECRYKLVKVFERVCQSRYVIAQFAHRVCVYTAELFFF